jgi:hypothetical protein
MNDQTIAAIIAFTLILGFFVLMIVILIGFVDITEPSIAKLVGALFGYFTAMLNPIIVRYFTKKEETP